MKLKYNKERGRLVCEGKEYECSCVVRNELNGRRKSNRKSEVVYPIVKGVYYDKPYMPRTFPEGLWEVTEVEWTDDPIFAPCKIKTNAHQKVTVWSLTKDGCYDKATDEQVDDTGYYLHHSSSLTTVGCVRITKDSDASFLGQLIQQAKNAGEKIVLEVVL